MMAEQLTFDLPVRQARGRDAFFVAPSNARALQWVEAWPQWPDRRLMITGSEACGKSHLADVWAQTSGARVVIANTLTSQAVPALVQTPTVVEGLEQLPPAACPALFHLINLAAAEGQSLLFTSRLEARNLSIPLPDLQSRLQATPSVAIGLPDDSLMAALLVKLFADRQLRVSPDLIPYLTARIERSALGASAVVARLDAAALAQKSRITTSFARRILGG